jgi:hypothetical protein
MRGAPIARHAAPERGRVIQQHSRSSIDARGHTAVLLSTTQKQCCCCEASQSSACCEQRALTHDTTNSSPLAFEHMQRKLSCGSAACHLRLLGPHMKKVFDGGPRAPMRARVAEGNSSLCCRSLQERASFNEQQAARLLGVTKQRNSTRNSSTVAGRHQAAQFNTQQQHGRAAPRTIFARQCSGDPRCRCPPPRSWGRRRCTRAAKKKELDAEKCAGKDARMRPHRYTPNRLKCATHLRLSVPKLRRQAHGGWCAAVAEHVPAEAAVVLAAENAERSLARLAVVHDFGFYPLHAAFGGSDRGPAPPPRTCHGVWVEMGERERCGFVSRRGGGGDGREGNVEWGMGNVGGEAKLQQAGNAAAASACCCCCC